MEIKRSIRNKYFDKRKKNYYKINQNFFKPLEKLIKSNKAQNFISIYYPSSFEINVLKILDIEYFKKFNFLLPVVEKNNKMNFYQWKKNDILFLNKFGIPEPVKSKKIVPNFILLPMLAFDRNKNRLGYGKGFYDKYLNKYLRSNKKILTVGVAFSFQKYHKIPVNNKDFKLDFIITEKGIF